MNKFRSMVLAAALVSPIAAMSQGPATPATPSSAAAPSGATDQAERDRTQGGSTAGANGRQDPTIKLSNGSTGSGPAKGAAVAGQRSRAPQGGSTAGANGAQDPTIKGDPAAPPASK